MKPLRDLSFSEALNVIGRRDPRHYSWGFYSESDAPGPLGGGMGAMLWFEDRDELLEWIGRDLQETWLKKVAETNRAASATLSAHVLAQLK